MSPYQPQSSQTRLVKPVPTLPLFLALAACAPIAEDVPGQTSRDSNQAWSKPSATLDAIPHGAAFAEARCASCHAVGPTGSSPMATATRLREIGLRYPVDQLADAFAEGIVTAHPAMLEFVLAQEENRDLIAYLKSIQSSTGSSKSPVPSPAMVAWLRRWTTDLAIEQKRSLALVKLSKIQ